MVSENVAAAGKTFHENFRDSARTFCNLFQVWEVVNLSSFLLSPYSLVGTCYFVQNSTHAHRAEMGGRINSLF
jgi:hypothetical protein